MNRKIIAVSTAALLALGTGSVALVGHVFAQGPVTSTPASSAVNMPVADSDSVDEQVGGQVEEGSPDTGAPETEAPEAGTPAPDPDTVNDQSGSQIEESLPDTGAAATR